MGTLDCLMIMKSRSLGMTTYITNRVLIATINHANNRSQEFLERKFIMDIHRKDWASEWAARKVTKPESARGDSCVRAVGGQ